MSVFVISNIPRSVWASRKDMLPRAVWTAAENALKERSLKWRTKCVESHSSDSLSPPPPAQEMHLLHIFKGCELVYDSVLRLDGSFWGVP